MYIGQSRRLYARIYTHKSLWNKKRQGKPIPTKGAAAHVKVVQFDEVFIRPCPISKLNELECQLIAQYRPRHNVQGKPQSVPLSAILQKVAQRKQAQSLEWRR